MSFCKKPVSHKEDETQQAKTIHLFIVFPLSSTRLQQDEAFRTIDFTLAERFALAVFHSQLVGCSVNELECRENFGQVLLGGFEQWKNIVEFGQCEDDIIRRLWSRGGCNRYSGDDA